MTVKRLILGLLSVFVAFQIGLSLVSSWNAPQITDRLQLYQTDLLLHVTELPAKTASGIDLSGAQTALIGLNPLESALKQYQTVRQSAQTNLEKFQTQLSLSSRSIDRNLAAPAAPTAPSPQEQLLQSSAQQQQDLIDQLDLRIGIIQSQQGQVEPALQQWQRLAVIPDADLVSPNATDPAVTFTSEAIAETADILVGLWSEPPRILPNAEFQIQQTLDGWFRYQALFRLYTLQQRQDALLSLKLQQQQLAQQTFIKLALVALLPILGSILGAGLLIFLLVQRVTKGKQSLLAENANKVWQTPWTWETIWQVLVVGFFFAGQFLIPLLVLPALRQLLVVVGIELSNLGTRSLAVSVLFSYILIAAAALLVLYFSIRSKLPLSSDWFRLRANKHWFWWGLGGYLVALPLMTVVSILNQQIWRGIGGSNPLLQIVLEERDPIALGIFFFTAVIAAPIFEETLFRGFLLPSLTRYMSVSTAIALSSLIFATAHLSLSEIIPLTVLGAILGVVYTRTRSLLSSMLLHGMWNGVTMLGLFILGSGT
jgi:hypothetical protein